MNEKFPVPQAERIVGDFKDLNPDLFSDTEHVFSTNTSGEVITDPREILKRIFQEYSPIPYNDFEIVKTARDLELIQLATGTIKEWAKVYGRTEFVDITPDHIHFFKKGGTAKFTNGDVLLGAHSPILGDVLVDRLDDLSTCICIFHELWHACAAYTAIQVTTLGEIDTYRSGFSIKSRDGKREMFDHLEEALVGHATKRFVDEVLRKRDDFKELIQDHENGDKSIDTTRQVELTELLEYIDIVYEKNSEDYKSRDEIIDMFIRAQVTGNILPVARLIEKTFGKGYFRKLSEF